MRILALDIGDVWTGSAISDLLRIISKPFETVESKNLSAFLKKTIEEQTVDTIIIGHPITMKGTQSAQTLKVEQHCEQLKIEFPNCTFILWDERLTSKHAEKTQHARTAQEKRASHSIAAAYILQLYLQHLEFKSLTDS